MLFDMRGMGVEVGSIVELKLKLTSSTEIRVTLT